MRITVQIGLLLLLIWSSRGAAFVRGTVPWLGGEGIGTSQAVLALHPYQQDSLLPHWELYEHGLLDLRSYGELLLREQGLAYELEIVAEWRSKQRVDYRYRLQGYDVCDLRSALTRLHDGHVYQRGTLPYRMVGWQYTCMACA